MICKKCGAEVVEGIFCPECGTRLELTVETDECEEKIVQEENDTEKVTKDKIEYERLAKEKAETELKVAKEMAAAEKASNERRNLEARTYKGILYTNEQEVTLAREEDLKIEGLKQRLLTTRKQNERKRIFEEFKDDIRTVQARHRLEMLKIKIDQEKPKNIMYNRIYGWTVVLSFFMVMLISSLVPNSDLSIFLNIILSLWFCIGIPVWIVWKIVLIIKSKSKDYYLNIKDI